jgi:hypothetical protein
MGDPICFGCYLITFSQTGTELELLRSEWDADLSDDRVDALWPWLITASDLLASLVPSSLARYPPNDTE